MPEGEGEEDGGNVCNLNVALRQSLFEGSLLPVPTDIEPGNEVGIKGS